jgi:hypothetical protein
MNQYKADYNRMTNLKHLRRRTRDCRATRSSHACQPATWGQSTCLSGHRRLLIPWLSPRSWSMVRSRRSCPRRLPSSCNFPSRPKGAGLRLERHCAPSRRPSSIWLFAPVAPNAQHHHFTKHNLNIENVHVLHLRQDFQESTTVDRSAQASSGRPIW